MTAHDTTRAGARCRRARRRDGARTPTPTLVRDRQGRPRALRRGRPGRPGGLAGQGLPGVRRHEAARHPDHRRTRGRVFGRHGVAFLNFHRPPGSTWRAGVDGLPDGARRRMRRPSRSASPCSRATRTSTRWTRACSRARRGCAGVVCAGSDVARARTLSRTMVPGIRTRGSTRTTRRASDTPARRDRAWCRLAGDRSHGHRRRRRAAEGGRRPRDALSRRPDSAPAQLWRDRYGFDGCAENRLPILAAASSRR